MLDKQTLGKRDAFIAVMGGSGSMVLEAIVHMAALGTFETDTFHVLIVEVDNGNGNLRRTRDALEAYMQTHDVLRGQTSFFLPRFEIYTWSPYNKGLSDRQSSLEAMLSGDGDALMLSKQLFTDAEMRHTIDVGFKGHPNLGVLFMDKLLKEDDRDEHFVINRFLKAYMQSKADRIMLIGSCFGGTGAACIPAVGRFLRRKLKALGSKDNCLAALVMLPTFDVMRPDLHEDLDPDSDSFRDKVKTVLADYMHHDFWPEDGQAPLYRQLYLLGAPDRIVYPNYAAGASEQMNPANFYTWFATTAVKQFLASDSMAGIYVVWQKDTPFGFARFSNEVFPGLERKAANMMQAILIYLTEYEKEIARFPKVDSQSAIGNHIAAISDGYSRRAFPETLSKTLKPFDDYALAFIGFIGQIATHLPLDAAQESWEEQKQAQAFHQVRYRVEGKPNPYLASALAQRFFKLGTLYKLMQLEVKSAKKTPKDTVYAESFLKLTDPLCSKFKMAQPYSVIHEATEHVFLNRPAAMIPAFVREKIATCSQEPESCAQTLLTALFTAFDLC